MLVIEAEAPAEAPADARLGSRAAYMAALGSWAAETLSSPEPSWRGPGTYKYGGYQDDDGRPVATLERTGNA